ncbi:MAG: hypothetical protein U9O20_03740 [Patescibacteria group bacterium]|nr:hypothetical protein [Patescibacteria group bacterium]
METQVTKTLDQNGVQYKIKQHQDEVLTCELDAKERGCRIFRIVKTMVGKED